MRGDRAAERLSAIRSDRLLPRLSIALIGLLYLLTFPQNFTEGEDAVYYADRVAGAVPMWHPNHLLYEPLMHGLTRAPWPGADALAVMQLASLVAALWSLALVWKIARLAGGGLSACMVALWSLAGCFAFWLYGMYPDTYALPLPFVLAGVVALWQAIWDQGGARAAAFAGVLAGLDWAAGQGAEAIVTAAADTPFFPCDLVPRLQLAGEGMEHPLVLAATPDPERGILRQPTFGLWPVALRDDLRAALEDGLRKVVIWTEAHGGVEEVFETVPMDPFFNVNRPADLCAAERFLMEMKA